jgi:bifunctional UDP-N-acetylglucosamine pyrophosphorylase / glucosamine-1-phosphate N-acetyltransferase
MALAAVIMAAGLGTRMKSATPKHLHPLLGRRLVDWIVEAVKPVGADPLVVVTSPGAANLFGDVTVAVQPEPLGTGDALRTARASVDGATEVLVLSGDHPRITAELLERFVSEHRASGATATVLSFEPDDPRAYGRIVRDGNGGLERIVEDADADERERAIREVSSSMYVFDADKLWPALDRIEPVNAQGELYLTDAVKLLVEAGDTVGVFKAPDPDELEGVNTRAELADAAAFLRARVNREHMLAGVTIVDPQTTWIDAEVELAPDSTIHPFTVLRGRTRVAKGAQVGPHVVAVDAEIGEDAVVGPFCYLRPGTVLGKGAKAGTFVERQDPAPVLYRRRGHRRGHQRRGREHHREPRPRAGPSEAKDQNRSERQDGHSEWLSGAGGDRRRRMDCRRGVHNRRCPSEIAGRLPAEAGNERGLSPWRA